MEYTSLAIKDLISKSEDKELLLPNFQRNYVWERGKNQKQLLTSILYDIPIGSLLTLNGESGFFATKELCVRQQFDDTSRDSTLYLLDGQQRISTIKSIFFDFFIDPEGWQDSFDNLYPLLRTRWFLRVIPKSDEPDVFGWKKLKFDGVNDLSGYTPGEIENFVEYEVLHLKKNDRWFHPEYKKNDWYNKESKLENKNNRKKIICEEASKQGYVPLYSIISNEDKMTTKLHYKVLVKIAQKRVEALKADILDGKINREDILDECEYEDEESLEECWKSLESDWVNEVYAFLNNINEKKIPIIELVKDEMSRAIYTFERVNKGGTSLSTYDLVVAKAAQNTREESLTDRIISLINKEIEIPESLTKKLLGEKVNKWNPKNMDLIKDEELSNFMKNQYLNLLSIFSYLEYEKEIENITLEYIKKDKHLNIESSKINNNTEITVKSILRACAFLQFRCGIIRESNLNYQLMILPIAYVLRDDMLWNDEKTIDKIEYWYWVSLFGGSYRIAQNEQCIGDIIKLYKYVKQNNNELTDRKDRVMKVEDYSNYDTLIFRGQNNKVPNAVYDGVLQYILSKQPNDFVDANIKLNAWDIAEEKEYYSSVKGKNVTLNIQDHHICPLSRVTKLGQSTKELRDKPHCILNSVLNRTLITSTANSIISDKKPEDYFKEVSDLAKYRHCIPSPVEDKYKRNDTETDEVYYERIIKERYNEIVKYLEQELDELK